jgi:hypothetical protein
MTIPSPSCVMIPEDQATPADPNTRINSLEEVIKRISESVEAMKKTNEDLISRLPLQKQPRHEERRKTVGKEKVRDKEEESSVHGDHHAKTHSEKNSSNKKSRQTKTLTEQSSEEASSYQPSRHSKSYRSQVDRVSGKKSQAE